MGDPTLRRTGGSAARDRTLAVFLAFGALVGAGLGLLVGREDLQSLWFTKTDIWLVPRCSYWVAHGVALLAALGLATAIDGTLRHTLNFVSRRALRVLASGALVITSIPLVGCGLTLIIPLLSEEGFGFGPYLVGAPLVALLIALAMFLLTAKWYNLIVFLLAVAALLARPIASLITLPLHLPNREVMPCMMAMALLALLCGWWLVRDKGQGPAGTPQEHDEAPTTTA